MRMMGPDLTQRFMGVVQDFYGTLIQAVDVAGSKNSRSIGVPNNTDFSRLGGDSWWYGLPLYTNPKITHLFFRRREIANIDGGTEGRSQLNHIENAPKSEDSIIAEDDWKYDSTRGGYPMLIVRSPDIDSSRDIQTTVTRSKFSPRYWI